MLVGVVEKLLKEKKENVRIKIEIVNVASVAIDDEEKSPLARTIQKEEDHHKSQLKAETKNTFRVNVDNEHLKGKFRYSAAYEQTTRENRTIGRLHVNGCES